MLTGLLHSCVTNAPATIMPVFGQSRAGPLGYGTVGVALLGSLGENVTKVGTILPLPYPPLSANQRTRRPYNVMHIA